MQRADNCHLCLGSLKLELELGLKLGREAQQGEVVSE